jgi:PII-like signaling protein
MSTEYLKLTVFVDETDTSGDQRLFEAIVVLLQHLGVSGATVQRGVMGFGKSGKIHRAGLFGVSDDHPMMIMSIDEASKIRAAAQEIKQLMTDGMVTLEPVEVA